MRPTSRLPTILLLSASLLIATASMAVEREVLEAIVIRVNDRVVTMSDFRIRLNQELAQNPQPPAGKDLQRFAHNLFIEMADEMVLLERATERRMTVEDKSVDMAIEDLRRANEFGTDEAFQAALDQIGLNEDELRERYRQTILLQRVVTSEIKPVEVTSEELRQVWERDVEKFGLPERVLLEQIFVPYGSDSNDDVMARMRGLVLRVLDGADFGAEATLAGVSVDDLGEIPVNDLRAELRGALEGLVDGEPARPLELDAGVQVLRLIERRAAEKKPFEEVSEEIERDLSRESFESQTKGLIDRLSKDYLIEKSPGLLDRIVPGAGSL